MIREYWSLRDVPTGHRVNSLTNAISETFGLCQCGYDLGDEEISSGFTHIRMGQLALVNFAGNGTHWCERKLAHLRADYADRFLMYIPNGSQVTISQHNQTRVFGADKIGFVNTKYAYRGRRQAASGDSFESSHVIVPGSLLRSRFPNADLLAGVAVTVDPSLLNVLNGFIQSVCQHREIVSDLAYRGLERVLLELVSSASECALNRAAETARAASEVNVALERVTSHILRNLTDPSLSISRIASDLNMSVRHIHNLFEDTDWTAKNWIKHRRLLECRKAVHASELAGKTLTEIAYTWGFSDFSHFSRCYKDKFGITPSEDRKQGVPPPSQGTGSDDLYTSQFDRQLSRLQ